MRIFFDDDFFGDGVGFKFERAVGYDVLWTSPLGISLVVGAVFKDRRFMNREPDRAYHGAEEVGCRLF